MRVVDLTLEEAMFQVCFSSNVSCITLLLLDGSSSSNARTNRSRDTESYGVIASIKSTFGFIQPIIGEEQIYFSDRDFYDNMKVGDKVGYFPRSSNKGQQAEGVRYLAPHLEKIIPTARGVILRNPDRHRNLMGLLEVDLASLKPEVAAVFERSKEIPFRHNDIVESSIPKHYRMDKGDTVEISISKVHDSSLMFACNVKMLALNKERQIAVQIQRMLDAGAVREMGVVSTLKRGEYGFIRAQDRKEEIYFRMDDAVEEEDSSSAKLVEVCWSACNTAISGKWNNHRGLRLSFSLRWRWSRAR